MTVADLIKEARRMSGMSQRELAKASGIHASNLSDYENNKTIPRADKLLLILKTAGFDLGLSKNGRVVV